MADVGSPRLLRKSAYADHRGVSPGMVTHWLKGGRIVLDTTGKLVDVERSDAALAASLHPTRGGKRGAEVAPVGAAIAPTNAYTAHRATREEFASKEAELDYLERIGTLVERGRYDKALADALQPIMAALDRLAPTLGPVLAGQTDARKVQNLIDDAVDEIRRDMAGTVRQMMGGPGTVTQ